jgi:hypothetical protein
MSTHAAIDRLASLSSEELTVADVAFVLGRSRNLAEKLVRDGEIESQAQSVRTSQAKSKLAQTPSQRRYRYSIAAAAMLLHLVKCTRGDKTVILAAIEERFPKHHKLCQRAAQSGPHSPLCGDPAPTPSNVIPMSSAKRPRALKANQDHPDQMFLFQFSA